MSAGTLYTASEIEKKRVRCSSISFVSSSVICILIPSRYKQISAIAAFAGLSVEVKESTADIIKTPNFVSKDGFSVFGASAIGRYGESHLSAVRSGTPLEYRGDPYLQRTLNDMRGSQYFRLISGYCPLYVFRTTDSGGYGDCVDEYSFARNHVTLTLLTTLLSSLVHSS